MNRQVLQDLSFELSKRFQKTIAIESCQVYDGDINQSFIVNTSSGRFFLKTTDTTPTDMFEKEFNGLNFLTKPGCIDIPKAILYGKNFLVMEVVEKGVPSNDFWFRFAKGLAELHKQSQQYFGLHENNYIGSLPQQNNLTEDWYDFYRNSRIMPFSEKAYSENKLDRRELQQIEKLCSKFDSLFPHEQPALLHGDLWSGNFMANEKGLPVIYDPAVYYGSREMDIAMSLLFGGFDKKFYQHYNEIFPLEEGWENRVSLCQLYPLLVHLVLFGGHYHSTVMSIVKNYA